MRHQRNYTVLVAMAFLQGLVFYAPVATVYRQTYGLSLSGLFLIESVSWTLTLILEIPFGRIADRFGCRKTIVAGSFVFFSSKLVFAAASGFVLFLAERVILSVALAALSGASENFLHASVGDEDPEGRFGVWNAAATAGLLASSLLAPLLYRSSLRFAAYATALAYALAAILSLFLDEPEAESARGRVLSLESLRTAFRALLFDRSLVRFLAAMAVSLECAQAVTVFLSQGQYARAGLGRESFGILYALVQIAALLGASAGKVARRFGRKPTLKALLCVECASAAALATSSSPGVTIAAFLAMSAAAAVVRPLSTAVQVERIRHPDRATALSLNAMIGEFVAAAVNVFEGGVAQRSLALGFWAAAGLLGVLLLFSGRLLDAAAEAAGKCAEGLGKRR